MRIKNTVESFGWLSIGFHWLMAIALIGMYFLGDYMVDLDYYDQWYKSAPDIHKSLGIIIGVLMLLRLLWNRLQVKPEHLDPDTNWQNMLASSIHYLLYLSVFVIVISGYLISTAKGQGIDVFGFFEVPALLPDDKDRGEFAGETHELFASGFMLLVALHASAALFHHFIKKDRTLKRMLGFKSGD